MPEFNLIPGVDGPPHAAVNARQLEMDRQRARRRESIEDLLDCAVLIVVNLVFLLWSEAKVPFLDRDTTMVLLMLANLFTIGSYVRTRILPRWKARRIAATWSAAERERFAAHAR